MIRRWLGGRGRTDGGAAAAEGIGVSPIFVGGSGRCGTTILGRTLGLHPDIFTFPDEPKFLAEMPGSLLEYARNPEHPTLGPQFEKRIRGYFFRRWSEKDQRDVGICTYVKKPHYRATVERFLDTFPAPELEERFAQVRTFLTELYSPSVERHGARRWCDDSPLTVLYLLDLVTIFPDMKFVHVIRDGRAVARSYCRLGWCPTMASALKLWHSRVVAGRLISDKLPEGRYLEVSFSALVAEPEAQLRRILEFAEEPWAEEMEAHRVRPERAFRHAREVDPHTNDLFLALAEPWCHEFGWPIEKA